MSDTPKLEETGRISHEFATRAGPGEQIFENIHVAYPGLATGRAKIIENKIIEPEDYEVETHLRDLEVEKFWIAYGRTIQTIEDRINAAKADTGFDAPTTEDIVESLLIGRASSEDISNKDSKNIPTVFRTILKNIKDNGKPANRAAYETLKPAAERMEENNLGDSGKELKTILKLFLQHYDPNSQPDEIADLDFDTIVFQDAMSFGDVTKLKDNRGRPIVKGAITSGMTSTSHGVIASKSMRMLLGWGEDIHPTLLKDGDRIILDGLNGVLIINPTEEKWKAYRDDEAEHEKSFEVLVNKSKKRRNAVSTDNVEFKICANGGALKDANGAKYYNASALGLIRTEEHLLGLPISQRKLSVEQWVDYIEETVEESGRTNNTFRLPDFAGDKKLEGLQPEDYPEINRNFIEATLIARDKMPSKKIHLMAPMIREGFELDTLQEQLNTIAEQKGLKPFQLGSMCEDPAFLDQLEAHRIKASFISTGSNDMIAGTLALGRFNPDDDAKKDITNLAVLKNLRRPIIYQHDHATPQELPVSICGDAASEPENVALLVGMGYRRLSVAQSKIPEIKELVTRIDTGQRFWELKKSNPEEYERLRTKAKINDHPDNAWALFQRIKNEPNPERRQEIKAWYNENFMGVNRDGTLNHSWKSENNPEQKVTQEMT